MCIASLKYDSIYFSSAATYIMLAGLVTHFWLCHILFSTIFGRSTMYHFFAQGTIFTCWQGNIKKKKFGSRKIDIKSAKLFFCSTMINKLVKIRWWNHEIRCFCTKKLLFQKTAIIAHTSIWLPNQEFW